MTNGKGLLIGSMYFRELRTRRESQKEKIIRDKPSISYESTTEKRKAWVELEELKERDKWTAEKGWTI